MVDKCKNRVLISRELCKGCGLCIHFCPENAISVDNSGYNSMGLHPVKWSGKCSFCGICFNMCPETAIEITDGTRE
ncbi:MAG: 4Fe-4S binding protein [Chitinivibrionales bacterium]